MALPIIAGEVGLQAWFSVIGKSSIVIAGISNIAPGYQIADYSAPIDSFWNHLQPMMAPVSLHGT